MRYYRGSVRYYRVFKRGYVYRVAAPGRYLWHWSRVCTGSDYEIFETYVFPEALKQAKLENSREQRRFDYKRDRWTEAHG
jgi:hypothetical protein